ncbi:MAG: T9SS type A sorting domain-containing protein [Saprospiraceae bacterium]|nr:T9SS type A sorting domain-containing protein [Saprospiraceae bacterium]
MHAHYYPLLVAFFLWSPSFSIAQSCCDGSSNQLQIMLMQYTASPSCGTAPALVNCTPATGILPATAYIVAKAEGGSNNGLVWFEGDVSTGETFVLNALTAGVNPPKLSPNTKIEIYNTQGGTLLQSVAFHTSCSEPIDIGDRFGASIVLTVQVKNDDLCVVTDFGDAPSTYGTLVSDNGAGAIAIGPYLGSVAPDHELDGVPSFMGQGDDDGTDDEDGLESTATLLSRASPSFNIRYTKASAENIVIAGWLDVDADQMFDSAEGQEISVVDASTTGVVTMSFPDISAPEGETTSFLRLRITAEPSNANSRASSIMSPYGITLSGEVEDHMVTFPSAILSVNLVSFSAERFNTLVDLNWVTSQEYENEHIHIERSPDGQEFKPIGTIDGQGTRQGSKAYRFQDQKPLDQMAFYRLRFEDFSGASTFSPIRKVHGNESLNLHIYPTPAFSFVTIASPVSGTFRIMGTSGSVLRSGDIDKLRRIAIDDLPSGAYMVQVLSDLRAPISGKLIVK